MPSPVKVKRFLFASAMILAAIAFATMFAPLSSHVYTVEEEKPYPTVTSWTEQWSSVSTSYTTEEHTKTRYTFTDDPDDSLASQDIDLLTLEKEGDLLHIYLSLSHGKFGDQTHFFRIGIDLDTDVTNNANYIIWYFFESPGWGCELWKYPERGSGTMVSTLQYELNEEGDLLHITLPIQKIGGETTFYIWAELNYLVEKTIYCADEVGFSSVNQRYTPPNPVDLEATYSETYTLYRTSTYTSTLSSIYTTTSTETHTLTEKVSLSYWHGWLPYPFFVGAGAAVITLYLSEAIPYIKSKRKKAAPPVIALPEGARLVKLCPTCGVENPFDAEYCMECGAKLS